MYAGTTIRNGSGRIVGVHQKIDRAARFQLRKLIKSSDNFPNIKDILHFEGRNGPDGLKRKHPSSPQAWYFINPKKDDDRELIEMINNHIVNLAIALRLKDSVRSSFEAAWLAHAIVDGLTPAHHYPLGDKIEELWGKASHERFSIWEKNVIKGDGVMDTISKNWQYWGAKGAFTTHGVFELGVASAVSTENFRKLSIGSKQLNEIAKRSFEDMFIDKVHAIDRLGLYEDLGRNGWTPGLARKIKNVLVPQIITTVTLAWYKAVLLSREDIK